MCNRIAHGALLILTCPACFTKGSKDREARRVFEVAPLGVPLQPQYKAGRIGTEHSFDRVILRNGFDDQTRSRPVDRLAVQRIHHNPGRANNSGQRAGYRDRVAGTKIIGP